MKIPMDDIQSTVETESGLNELVHSIITALNIRARVRDDDSLFQRGQQLAREMNAGVLHIAYDGFTSTEEAMELIKNQEAQAADIAELDEALGLRSPGPDGLQETKEEILATGVGNLQIT